MLLNQKFEPEETESWAQSLRENGFCIIPDATAPSRVKMLNQSLDPIFDLTPFCQGDFYGPKTKRFHKLLSRSPYTSEFVLNPLILSIVNNILSPYCDNIQLNLTQALELHQDAPQQCPHRDQDMWQGNNPDTEYLVNVMWPFTPYTAENGATVVWPGSHRRQDEVLIDPTEAITAEMQPGSALLFLGSTLHGAGRNNTPLPRRGMIISYCLGWLKPYENMWLTYPPEVARHFSKELAQLIGYRQHRPNLNNYDGRCPSILLHDGRAEHLNSIDNFAPDHASLLAEYTKRTMEEKN